MFTGIVEESGRVDSIRKKSGQWDISILAKTVLDGTKTGDSISVNGVCLTVVKLHSDRFTVQAVEESIRKSTIQFWQPGLSVNLERALPADGRLGGHIVQGHIDGLATIRNIKLSGESRDLTFQTDPAMMELIVEKGSIAVDGISLTVSGRTIGGFSVAVIPHTLQQTTLLSNRVGDRVNIETDILGRYIRQMVQNESGSLDKETLKKWGYNV